MITLNFIATLCLWVSRADWLLRPVDFWEWSSILEAKRRNSGELHDMSRWRQSECKGSLFFSKKPLVSYRTWGTTQAEIDITNCLHKNKINFVSQKKGKGNSQKKTYGNWKNTKNTKFSTLNCSFMHELKRYNNTSLFSSSQNHI